MPGRVGTAIGSFEDGTALAIALDGLTFFATTTVLLFLTVPSPLGNATGEHVNHSLRTDVRSGFNYIWHRTPLLWLLAAFAFANMNATPAIILQPLLLKSTLAADLASRGFSYESALALLGTADGVGGVAAGIIVSVWGGLKRHRIRGVLVPMILGGLATVALGLSSSLYLSALTLLVFSFMGPFLHARAQTIWQTQTPHEMQGRVFAVRRPIGEGTLPVASGLSGVLGGAFGAGAVIAGCGAVQVLFCLVQLFNQSLLRVEDRAWLDELAAGQDGSHTAT